MAQIWFLCLNVARIRCFQGRVDTEIDFFFNQIRVTLIYGLESVTYLIYGRVTWMRTLRSLLATCATVAQFVRKPAAHQNNDGGELQLTNCCSSSRSKHHAYVSYKKVTFEGFNITNALTFLFCDAVTYKCVHVCISEERYIHISSI